jgi:hypothetical protein
LIIFELLLYSAWRSTEIEDGCGFSPSRRTATFPFLAVLPVRLRGLQSYTRRLSFLSSTLDRFPRRHRHQPDSLTSARLSSSPSSRSSRSYFPSTHPSTCNMPILVVSGASSLLLLLPASPLILISSPSQVSETAPAQAPPPPVSSHQKATTSRSSPALAKRSTSLLTRSSRRVRGRAVRRSFRWSSTITLRSRGCLRRSGRRGRIRG